MNPEFERFVSGMSLYGSIAPFHVLADWLQQQGDPWGELISLQCLPTSDPTARDHRTLQLIDELAPRLWPSDDFLVKSYWRGFVSSIHVTDSEGVGWLHDQLEHLLDAPGTVLCTELSFRNTGLGDGNVPMLIDMRDRFQRMTRLDFNGNLFGLAAVARLYDAYPHATFAHQGPDTTGGGRGKSFG